MRLKQTRDLAGDWFIEIRYNKRTTFHFGRWGVAFPKTFYSEQALIDWANIHIDGFKNRATND